MRRAAPQDQAKPLLAAVFFGLFAAFASLAAEPARAEDCPGNPDALGTSRTLVVDPTEHPRVGTMQYGETLPLRDHEVVLTFDDGPLPAHSNKVLATLAAECVKATFFTIGRMAQAYPDGVRRLRAAGHTIGTHSENHPLSFNRMPVERAVQEIDDGIDHTAAALGDPAAVAPFFRIPGLLRAEGVENYLASRGIMTWSADFPADDWRHISSARVLQLALTRLEAHRKGILLLHDIQARTAAMLPTLLRQLKARGYHIVHVVPATPELPKTPTEPRDWLMHPDAGQVVAWPAVPHMIYTQIALLAAPRIPSAGDATLLLQPVHATWQNRDASLSLSSEMPVQASATEDLPAPDPSIFNRLDLPHIRLATDANHSQHPALVPSYGRSSHKQTTVAAIRSRAVKRHSVARKLPRASRHVAAGSI